MTHTAATASSIVAFLRARLDEDEMSAVGAARGPWVRDSGCSYPQRVTNSQAVLIAQTYTSPNAPACDVEHIVRFNPDRVLREVEAKRAVIDDFTSTAEWMEFLEANGTSTEHEACARHAGSVLGVLRLLAAVYSGHPDYAAMVGPVTS